MLVNSLRLLLISICVHSLSQRWLDHRFFQNFLLDPMLLVNWSHGPQLELLVLFLDILWEKQAGVVRTVHRLLQILKFTLVHVELACVAALWSVLVRTLPLLFVKSLPETCQIRQVLTLHLRLGEQKLVLYIQLLDLKHPEFVMLWLVLLAILQWYRIYVREKNLSLSRCLHRMRLYGVPICVLVLNVVWI